MDFYWLALFPQHLRAQGIRHQSSFVLPCWHQRDRTVPKSVIGTHVHTHAIVVDGQWVGAAVPTTCTPCIYMHKHGHQTNIPRTLTTYLHTYNKYALHYITYVLIHRRGSKQISSFVSQQTVPVCCMVLYVHTCIYHLSPQQRQTDRRTDRQTERASVLPTEILMPQAV